MESCRQACSHCEKGGKSNKVNASYVYLYAYRPAVGREDNGPGAVLFQTVNGLNRREVGFN